MDKKEKRKLVSAFMAKTMEYAQIIARDDNTLGEKLKAVAGQKILVSQLMTQLRHKPSRKFAEGGIVTPNTAENRDSMILSSGNETILSTAQMKDLGLKIPTVNVNAQRDICSIFDDHTLFNCDH